MTREQLAHVLRAVSQLTGDPRVVAKSGQRAMIVPPALGQPSLRVIHLVQVQPDGLREVG